jgi:hypothetical protein
MLDPGILQPLVSAPVVPCPVTLPSKALRGSHLGLTETQHRCRLSSARFAGTGLLSHLLNTMAGAAVHILLRTSMKIPAEYHFGRGEVCSVVEASSVTC